MICSLQFASAMHSQLKPPRVVFEDEGEALREAERLLRQAGIDFTLMGGSGDSSFVDREGRVLIRVVCHAR